MISDGSCQPHRGYRTFATLKSYSYLCSIVYLLIWNIFAKVIIFNELLAKYATFFYPSFAFLRAGEEVRNISNLIKGKKILKKKILKTSTMLFSILLFVFCACEKQGEYVNLKEINGMSLYWHFTASNEDGRYLLFEFYGNEAFENSYQLVFDYKVTSKSIIVSLVDIIDKGECPKYPGDWNTGCVPSGNFIIPETELPKSDCDFILKTPNFSVTSRMIFDQDIITLEIPENSKFTTSIKNVYPIPANILYGSVVYYNSQYTQAALDFLTGLEQLNLTKTTLPDSPYRYLLLDENGKPIYSDWPPDSHSIGLLYQMNEGFDKIVEVATSHFNNSNINIYLFSSNGDEAHFSKIDGIHIFYTQK
jgi:hypothetical protein